MTNEKCLKPFKKELFKSPYAFDISKPYRQSEVAAYEAEMYRLRNEHDAHQKELEEEHNEKLRIQNLKGRLPQGHQFFYMTNLKTKAIFLMRNATN